MAPGKSNSSVSISLNSLILIWPPVNRIVVLRSLQIALFKYSRQGIQISLYIYIYIAYCHYGRRGTLIFCLYNKHYFNMAAGESNSSFFFYISIMLNFNEPAGGSNFNFSISLNSIISIWHPKNRILVFRLL